MSQVRVQGNASGTGILTVTSPNTNSNYTLTLPAQTGTVLTNASTTGFPAGSVLQVVQTVYTPTNSTSSTSFVDTGLTASITPSSSSSKILVFSNVTGNLNEATGYGGYNLVRGSTDIMASVIGVTASTNPMGYIENNYSAGALSIPFVYLDSPATASSVTYKVQFKATAGTVYFNYYGADEFYRRGVSSLTLMEIAA